jgi:hypothetical protein
MRRTFKHQLTLSFAQTIIEVIKIMRRRIPLLRILGSLRIKIKTLLHLIRSYNALLSHKRSSLIMGSKYWRYLVFNLQRFLLEVKTKKNRSSLIYILRKKRVKKNHLSHILRVIMIYQEALQDFTESSTRNNFRKDFRTVKVRRITVLVITMNF